MRRTVTRVVDGDTVEVNRRIGNTRYVRLAGVNAPETYQRGGPSATRALDRLIGGKTVTVTPVGRSYGRVVADVRVNQRSVNKKLRSWGY